MPHADTIQQVPEALSLLNKVIRLFVSPRTATPESDRLQINIDWPDADPDSDTRQSDRGRYKQPVSGGYNEAFIVQHWSSYHLR